MKTNKMFKAALTAIFFVGILSSCSDSNEMNETVDQTKLKIMMTDAPVDDSNVQAVFVSFTAVKIDGESYTLDGTRTIELSALTEGNTEVLFNKNIKAGNYSQLTLVLDYEMDQFGNEPGCYVMTKNGMKHDLHLDVNQSNEIDLQLEDGMMSEMEDTELVVDFDLRKAIRYEANESMEDKYNFHGALENDLRVIEMGNQVMLEGRINNNMVQTDDKLVVYVYESGSYNAENEVQLNSRTDVMFESAISSCEIDENGYFSLHFLKRGDYDLKIVSYEINDSGKAVARAFLETGLLGGLNLLGINITSDTFLNLTLASRTEI